LPFLASSGWGILVADEDAVRIECTGGRLNVHSLTIDGLPWEPTDVSSVTLEAGEALIVRPSETTLRESDLRGDGGDMVKMTW
jgi:hypothetical protein